MVKSVRNKCYFCGKPINPIGRNSGPIYAYSVVKNTPYTGLTTPKKILGHGHFVCPSEPPKDNSKVTF